MSSAACSPDVALSTNSSPSSSGCSRSRAGPSSLPRSSRSSAFSSVTSGGWAATRTRGRRAGFFARRAFAFVAAWRGADCLVSRGGGAAAAFLPTFLEVGLRFLGTRALPFSQQLETQSWHGGEWCVEQPPGQEEQGVAEGVGQRFSPRRSTDVPLPQVIGDRHTSTSRAAGGGVTVTFGRS